MTETLEKVDKALVLVLELIEAALSVESELTMQATTKYPERGACGAYSDAVL
ncbi:MAG: hypothetical protein ACREQ5_00680 [Candidatus Dormibacteria bacterium]